MAATTRVLGSDDVANIVSTHGLNQTLDDLIERLTATLARFDPQKTTSPARQGFHYSEPHLGLLEWMPTMENGRIIAVKTVGYHPSNPTDRGLPSVMATTSVYDTTTGRLVALIDATLLTALRTGAASAIATDILARDEPTVLGVVGCGTQAVTQLHAISRVRPIERVLALDTDPNIAATFARRTAFMDRAVDVVAPSESAQMLQEVDVLCTATTVDLGSGPVIMDGPHKSWLHINAVGADFPGKQEIADRLLQKSLLCPDLLDQCRAEGESQRVEVDRLGPDLVKLVQERNDWRHARSALTIFDSTGWALEDMVAAELIMDLSAHLGIGTNVAIQDLPADPHDPYAALHEFVS